MSSTLGIDMRRLMITISVISFASLTADLAAAPRHSGGQSVRPGSASSGIRIGAPGVWSGVPLSGRVPRLSGAILVGGGYGGYPPVSGRIAPSYSGPIVPDVPPVVSGLQPTVPNPGLAIPSGPLAADPYSLGGNSGTPLPDQIGMRILDLIDGGVAKQVDLRPNDVILGVDDRQINSFDELQAALAQAKGEVNIIFINGENGRLERLPLTPVNGKIGVVVGPIKLR
jgi:membrane-associated protease RseP (regulator of RpoE activity)